MDKLVLGASLGIGVGLSLWLINVVSVGGIIQRPDIEGNMKLTLESLWEYVKLPFNPEKTDIAWATASNIEVSDRLKLLSLNWIVVAGLSAGLGTATLYYLQ